MTPTGAQGVHVILGWRAIAREAARTSEGGPDLRPPTSENELSEGSRPTQRYVYSWTRSAWTRRWHTVSSSLRRCGYCRTRGVPSAPSARNREGAKLHRDYIPPPRVSAQVTRRVSPTVTASGPHISPLIPRAPKQAPRFRRSEAWRFGRKFSCSTYPSRVTTEGV